MAAVETGGKGAPKLDARRPRQYAPAWMEHSNALVTERAASRRGSEEFGVAQREPFEVLFDPESLSGTERLAMVIAAHFRAGTPHFRRGRAFRAAILRPLYQVARQSAQRAASGEDEDALAARIPAPRTAADVHVLLHRRWGSDALSARSMLRRLQRLPDLALLPPGLQAWLERQRGERNESWRVGQQWGVLADVYLADLGYYASALEKEDEEEEAARLAQVDLALLQPESRAHLATLRQGERGTLFSGAHAGAFSFGRRVMRTQFPDMLLLGAHGETTQSDTRVSANDPVRAMLQMVKHLREPGAIALIGADGPVANAMQTVTVCGKRINVALGAPHIVYHARCSNVFYLARWAGDRVALDLRTDTQPEPGEGLEAWTARWMAAWVRFLEDIIRGDPRNLRGVAGFWAQLEEA